jgi:hypothetical protein
MATGGARGAARAGRSIWAVVTVTPTTLTVPAQPEYARLLRGVVDAIAAGADFSADVIDDVELAVTEAAGAILAGGPVDRLMLEIIAENDGLRCRLEAVEGDGDRETELDAIRSMVLDAVTTAHEVGADGAVTFVVGSSS